MHRKILVATFALAAFALPSLAQSSKLNGTWKLNVSKSTFGQLPPPSSETDTIAVNGADFKEQVTSVAQNGTQTYTRACTGDGKDIMIAADDPRSHIGAVTVSKVVCTWDGSSLVLTETASVRGNDLTDKLTFSGSADGKTMTMASHITSAMINADRMLVYDAADSSAAAAPAPAAGAAAATHASGSTPNLSGTWALNLSKSDFGPIPAPTSQISTIEDNEPSIKIVVDQKGGFAGDTKITSWLTSDGKETRGNSMGGTPITSVTHWDGDKLVVNSKTTIQDMDITITDTYSLSADGKTLTQLSRFDATMGTFDATEVYDKQ